MHYPEVTVDYVYCINELDNTIVTFSVAANGTLTAVGEPISTLPAGWGPGVEPPFDFYTAPSHAAEILIFTSSGKDFLAATNRGHDSVALYSLDNPGSPILIKTVPSGGRLPWTLAVTPDSEFLVVSNQFNVALKDPGNITVLRTSSDEFSLPSLATVSSITLEKVMCASVCRCETPDERALLLGLPSAPKPEGCYKVSHPLKYQLSTGISQLF